MKLQFLMVILSSKVCWATTSVHLFYCCFGELMKAHETVKYLILVVWHSREFPNKPSADSLPPISKLHAQSGQAWDQDWDLLDTSIISTITTSCTRASGNTKVLRDDWQPPADWHNWHFCVFSVSMQLTNRTFCYYLEFRLPPWSPFLQSLLHIFYHEIHKWKFQPHLHHLPFPN